MTATATPRHRVAVAVAHAHAEMDAVADSPVWSMTPDETKATLVEITRLKSKVAELEARVVEHADPDTVDDWGHATHQTRPAVLATARLAQALVVRTHLRHALAAGDLVVEQAKVIADALDELPTEVGAELVEEAERHLVAEAAHHDARTLRILGKRLLDVVAPDLADEYEAKKLMQEEADALLAAKLQMRDDGHGKCHGSFVIPSFHGAALKKMLMALAAPKHRAAAEGAGAPRRPGRERMGRALCELIERYPADQLPKTGGVSATVVVHIPLDVLEGLTPVVLGGTSEVLDVGRKARFHNQAQRLAIAIRDQHCTHPGCDWPPAMCHVHHDIAWARGGPTDVQHGRLLCPRHHARYHRRA